MPGATQPRSNPALAVVDVIRLFKTRVEAGQHWYLALLASAGEWPIAAEVIEGERQSYLIGGEAFDLMLLAERLLGEVGTLVPEAEKLAFLFNNQPPLKLSADEFKNSLGETRYCQYLNYFYGVTAEEALLTATEEDIRKEERGFSTKDEEQITDEAFVRVYSETETRLLGQFREGQGYPPADSLTLGQVKEFTYWLFKFRLSHSDPEKSASYTKKALDWLKKQQTII